MDKKLRLTGGIFGLTAVIIGAFGAHGLEKVLDASAIATFETGVKYQMYHALFLLFLGSTTSIDIIFKRRIFWLILIGVLFFSFSIYGLSTATITGIDFKSIAFITPVGGLFLISAWVLLILSFFKNKLN